MPRISNEKYQRKYIKTDLYKELRRLAKASDLNQTQIASEMGIQQSTFSKAMKNETLSSFQLITLIDILGYKIVVEPKEMK